MRSTDDRSGRSASGSYVYEEEEDVEDYSSDYSGSASVSRSFVNEVSSYSEVEGARKKRGRRRRHEGEWPGRRSNSSAHSALPALESYDRETGLSAVADASPSRSPTRLSVDAGTSMEEYSDYTPSSSPLSRSFLSYSVSHTLFESVVVQRVKRITRAVEKPLLFGVMSLAGSRVLRLLVALSNTVLLTRPSDVGVSSEVDGMPLGVGAEPVLPEGYPAVPPWMQELRASLPVQLVERPITRWLRWTGIPVLSEAIHGEAGQRWSAAATAVSEGMRKLKSASQSEVEVWVTSQPMIPTAVVLPLLTLVLLHVGRSWSEQRMEKQRESMVRTWMQDSPSDLLSGVVPRSLRELSPILPDVSGGYSEPQWSPRDMQSPNPHPSATPSVDPVASPANISDSAKAEPHSSDEEPTEGEMERILKTPIGRAGLTVGQEGENDGPPAMLSPHVLPPVPVQVFATGTVVAALVGEPTLAEVNRVLTASSAYGCMKVLLPLSVRSMLHVAVSPGTALECTSNVLKDVMELGEQRQMAVVNVLARAVTAEAVHLSVFKHPPTGIYVFNAANGVDLEKIARAATHVVYAFEHGPVNTIPAIECFSQRLQYLRRQGPR